MERYPVLWIGKINNVKKSKLHKAIYRFKAVPIKIPMKFFSEREQIILKFKGNNRSQIAKAILKKKTKPEEITCPDLKLS